MTFLALVAFPTLLLLIGVPIFIALVGAAIVGMLILNPGTSLTGVHTAFFGGVEAHPLLAVPLFIFAGDVMARGGLARRLVNWVLSVIGAVRGSLAISTVASSELFGAMSGSSVGCVAAIGKMLMPSLVKHGYSDRFAGGLMASSGALAVILPPSIAMIIYGVAAQQPITDLFLAGIVPGLLVGVAMTLFLMAHARIKNIPRVGGFSRANLYACTREAIWSLLAPVVILGGIYGGIATPTEAAGVAAIYAVFVSVYVHREMTWKDVWQTALDSSVLIAQIMIIVAAAGAYAWLVTTSGLPGRLVQGIEAMHLTPIELLMLINLVLLVVGSVLEPPAAILILTPLVTPVVMQVGIDPIHFGIIMTMNLAIGMFIPPLGLNVLAAHAIFGVPIPRLAKGVLPFLCVYTLCLLLITYVPSIVLAPLALLR